jgi:hypothetical protein
MRGLIVLAVAAACSVAYATPILSSAVRIDAVPAEWGAGGERATPIYSDLATPTDYYLAIGAGVEVADDLHMISAGTMVEFKFAYHDGGAGVPTATVNFYANNPSDFPLPGGNPPASLIASYSVTGLPGPGEWIVTVPVSAQALPMDVWMGVIFPASDVGLLTYSPPTVGSSHDIYALYGQGYWFGGNPPANFGLEVSTPEPCSLLLLVLTGLFLRRR